MKQLHIKVGSTVEIVRPCYLSANEVNTVECIFDLPAEYDGLIAKAQFTNTKPVTRLVEDGKCKLPPEALTEEGKLEIGVIAYAVEGEELVVRHSPTPAQIRVHEGSFNESAEESGAATPTVFEEQIAKMQRIVDSAAEDVAKKVEEKLGREFFDVTCVINPNGMVVEEISNYHADIQKAYDEGKTVRCVGVFTGAPEQTMIGQLIVIVKEKRTLFSFCTNADLGQGVKIYHVEVNVFNEKALVTVQELLTPTSIINGSEVYW